MRAARAETVMCALTLSLILLLSCVRSCMLIAGCDASITGTAIPRRRSLEKTNASDDDTPPIVWAGPE